jgi:hypothetical protein
MEAHAASMGDLYGKQASENLHKAAFVNKHRSL